MGNAEKYVSVIMERKFLKAENEKIGKKQYSSKKGVTHLFKKEGK